MPPALSVNSCISKLDSHVSSKIKDVPIKLSTKRNQRLPSICDHDLIGFCAILNLICNETDLFISHSLNEKIWELQYINLALLLHQNFDIPSEPKMKGILLSSPVSC
jgi:hypothetical protein